MLRRRTVIAVVLLLLLVFVFLLIRVLIYGNSSTSRAIRNKLGVRALTTSTLYDLSGSKIPFNIYFDSVKGIVISGVVMNVIDSDIKSLEIESELNGKHVLVRSSFPDLNPIIVLKLPEGKPVSVEEWTGYFFDDIRDSITTGKQVTIHIESDEESAQKILTRVNTQSGSIEVGEIARMIIPE